MEPRPQDRGRDVALRSAAADGIAGSARILAAGRAEVRARAADRLRHILRRLPRSADHWQYACLDHETCLRGLSDCRCDLLLVDQFPAVGEDAAPATASTAAPACRPGPGLSAGPLTA